MYVCACVCARIPFAESGEHNCVHLYVCVMKSFKNGIFLKSLLQYPFKRLTYQFVKLFRCRFACGFKKSYKHQQHSESEIENASGQLMTKK